MAFRDVTNTIQHVQSSVALEGENKPRRHRGSAEPVFASALESLESGLETNENAFRVFTDCEHSSQVVTSWKVPATFIDLAWIHAKFQKQDLGAVRVRIGGGVFAKFPSEKVSAEQGVYNDARGEVTKIHRDGTLEVKWADGRLSNVPREWVRVEDLDAVRVRIGGGVFAKFPSEKVSAEQGVYNDARGEVTKIHRDGTLEVKWANGRFSNVPREWVRFVSHPDDLDAVRVSVDDVVFAKFPCGKVSAEQGVRNNARGEVTKMHRDGTLEVKWADASLTNVPREWVRFASREEFIHDGVYEYIVDIFQCMRRAQERRPLNPDFMRTQPHVNTRMRAILNDWLFAVHLSFRFRMETLFLAVACTDRYLSRNVVRRQHFQLVGVTAMFIAAKVEEIVVPALSEFVRVTGSAYTNTDVLSMECGVLTCVCGDIACPTAAHFLKTFIDVGRCTDTLHCELAHYITTLSILDSSMIGFSPSCIAAAALSLSSDLLSQHRHISCCANESIQTCVPELRALLNMATSDTVHEHGIYFHTLRSVPRAFSRNSHHCIAIKAAHLL